MTTQTPRERALAMLALGPVSFAAARDAGLVEALKRLTKGKSVRVICSGATYFMYCEVR